MNQLANPILLFADFEECSTQEETKYWDAHELMRRLGYETYASFSKVINRAIASCVQLDIQITEAFVPSTLIEEGKTIPTYKLTRFACFLTSMHADDKKPEVAAAKAYFAAIASSLIDQAISDEDLPRIEVRDQIRMGEKLLSGVAKAAGIEGVGYALFKDAGIRGMYNMGLKDLMRRKGVDRKAVLYDFMGFTELAGNYFRITQTAERVKNHNIHGLRALQNTAQSVGSDVRRTMVRNSGGVTPESLPVSEDIKKVKTRLKTTNRGMAKLDKGRKIAN